MKVWHIFAVGNPSIVVGVGLTNHVGWMELGLLIGVGALVSFVEWVYFFEGYRFIRDKLREHK